MVVLGGYAVVSSSRRSVRCKALLHVHWHVVSGLHIRRCVNFRGFCRVFIPLFYAPCYTEMVHPFSV